MHFALVCSCHVHPAMIHSLRFPGVSDDIADEVGLYEALDLELDDVGADEVPARGEVGTAEDAAPRGSPTTEMIVLDALGQSDDMYEEMEAAAHPPPLPFTSSTLDPIPHPGSPPPATVEEISRGLDPDGPDSTRPPPCDQPH